MARIHSSAFSYEGVLVGAVVLLLKGLHRGGDSSGLGDVWGFGGYSDGWLSGWEFFCWVGGVGVYMKVGRGWGGGCFGGWAFLGGEGGLA